MALGLIVTALLMLVLMGDNHAEEHPLKLANDRTNFWSTSTKNSSRTQTSQEQCSASFEFK